MSSDQISCFLSWLGIREKLLYLTTMMQMYSLVLVDEGYPRARHMHLSYTFFVTRRNLVMFILPLELGLCRLEKVSEALKSTESRILTDSQSYDSMYDRSVLAGVRQASEALLSEGRVLSRQVYQAVMSVE